MLVPPKVVPETLIAFGFVLSVTAAAASRRRRVSLASRNALHGVLKQALGEVTGIVVWEGKRPLKPRNGLLPHSALA